MDMVIDWLYKGAIRLQTSSSMQEMQQLKDTIGHQKILPGTIHWLYTTDDKWWVIILRRKDDGLI